MTACDDLSMLHGRLGFFSWTVDGPLGGGLLTWGTWREGPQPAKPQLGARDPGNSVVHHVQYGVVQ